MATLCAQSNIGCYYGNRFIISIFSIDAALDYWNIVFSDLEIDTYGMDFCIRTVLCEQI